MAPIQQAMPDTDTRPPPPSINKRTAPNFCHHRPLLEQINRGARDQECHKDVQRRPGSMDAERCIEWDADGYCQHAEHREAEVECVWRAISAKDAVSLELATIRKEAIA